ncbi:MAG: GxxExxY protein [Thermoanaerobaculales bacterium]|jgi:GxxExxY protein|nr:GxxExxY protein [Thermoanaerobaculales bacterium]
MSEQFHFKEETHSILGACFEVYNELGCGFLEQVYQESLELEFRARNIPFDAQRMLHVSYKGRLLERTYVADFVCFDRVIIEIKAISRLLDEHRAQLLNYLHATTLDVGLSVNFGHYQKLEYERFVSRRLTPSVLSV